MTLAIKVSRQFIIILVAILCALIITQPTAAQESLEIDSNRAALSFPDSITFRLSVRGADDIEHISLTYGTDARNCQNGGSQHVIQFENASEIDVDWEWELKRSGSIPPGATIWWEWTLIDNEGNEYITERQEEIYHDNRYIWSELSRENVTAYWYAGDSTFGEQTLATALNELERIVNHLGVEPSGEIQMWIYATTDDLLNALVVSYEWAGAVAFPEHNAILVSLYPGQSDWATKAISHELTHLVVGTASFNCRGGHLPVWLNEGLAKAVEGPVEPAAQERIENALRDERLPPLASLADGFSAYSGGATQAYTHSGEAVRFLIENYGTDQLNSLVSTLKDGATIDQALEQEYGIDTNGLDALWRASLGFTPTPTAVARSAAKTTPTRVPTLAIIGPPVVSTSTPTPILIPNTPEPIRNESTETPTPPLDIAVVEVRDGEPTTTIALAKQSSPVSETAEQESGSNSSFPLWLAAIGIFLLILALTVAIFRWKGE